MNTVRMVALVGAAVFTMGSGGVAQTPSEEPTATYEPETVDVETSAGADATATDTETEIAAASSNNGTSGAASVPPSAVEMAEQGAAIELALSDDYLQGRYYTGGDMLGFSGTTGHLGLYFSDNRDIIGNVGVMTKPFPLLNEVEGLTLSAGARGYVALLSNPNDDVVGLAPGVEARYGLPYDGFPVAAVGNIFYSPDILTLGDANDILDLDARVEAEFIPDIVGFIGYREFRFDSDEGDDVKAASEIQVGARFNL